MIIANRLGELYSGSVNVLIIKEELINSRLTAEHATRLHIFRQAAQKISARRQPYLNLFVHPDKKSDCAICAPELISASLNTLLRLVFNAI